MKKRKYGNKGMVAVLLTMALVLGAFQPVYADDPAGPAADQEAIVLETQEENAPAGPAAVPDAVSEESQELPAGEADAVQEEEQQLPEEGLVASGGRYLDPNKPMVALTFDDGPYARVGDRIMDCLELYNGRATFFVVGNRIPAFRDEILRMHQNGHEVANHTQDHKFLTRLGAAQIRDQIEQCNQMIASVTGQIPALVRLPGGYKNNTVLANIHQPVIMWSIDTKDWKTRNAAKTVSVILNQVRDGDIILMHELYTQTGDAAAAVIPALAEMGYQMVTVSELAAFRGGLAPGAVYFSFYR